MLILLNWKLSYQFEENDAKRDLVQYLPLKLNDDFNAHLINYVIDAVFESPYDADDPMEEKDEWDENEEQLKRKKDLQRKEAILCQYVKLIMHGVLPVIDASSILRYYLNVSLLSQIYSLHTYDCGFRFMPTSRTSSRCCSTVAEIWTA